MTTNDADIAWAAGLFEGEGSAICRPTGGGRPGLQRHLVVTLTDLDVLEHFQAVVGAGNIAEEFRSNAKPHWKPIYRWRCNAWEDIERIARALLPWLGARRRVAVEYLLSNPSRAVGGVLTDACKRGHPRTDENTYIHAKTGTRHCRPCGRLKSQAWNRAHPDYFRDYHQAVRKVRSSNIPARQDGSSQP